jgi:DNA-binding MarR family transcriptional regulator
MYGQIEAMPIQVDSETQVSTREAHTIKAVGENQNMSVTQLAGHFGITKSGASQMVKKLINKGFLLKRQAAHSNKEFELSLTPTGWQVFEAHERAHGEDLNKLISGLAPFSISQIATLSVLLESFKEVMENRLSQRDTKG